MRGAFLIDGLRRVVSCQGCPRGDHVAATAQHFNIVRLSGARGLCVCRSLGSICLSLYFNDFLDQTVKYFAKVHSFLPFIRGYFLDKMHIELVRHEFPSVCQSYQKLLKLF